MRRILVIDDDASVRSTVKIVLEAQGCEIVTAENGRDGIAQIAGDNFDGVILDIFTPEMDGLETIRCIRRAGAMLPIIVVSGGSNLFDYSAPAATPATDCLDMATELGAVIALPKPFKPRELIATVNMMMKQAA